MTTWFISDTHWSHANILRYCDRPFKNADEMDEIMIDNWNRVVRPEDSIFHLGDFAFCPPDKAANIARRLHGRKFLLKGNHDRPNTLKALIPFFEWIKDVHLLTVQDTYLKEGKQMIWLSHYCHLAFPHQGHEAYHLFGHSHGKLQVPFGLKAVDVGVDSWQYGPVSYDQIKLLMSQHGGRKGI